MNTAIETSFTGRYQYYASVTRMMLCQFDERYVEQDEDEGTGCPYSDGFFESEEDAIAFAKSEMDEYSREQLAGRGYTIVHTSYGLDTIRYASCKVERMEYDEELDDYDFDYSYDDGFGYSSLPDKVYDAAMKAQRNYHAFLDYEDDKYWGIDE